MSSDDFQILTAGGGYRVSGVIERDEAPFPGPPSPGLVIGTFASVPYVHLQLEARRRFYPGIPLLVHDDGSPGGDELRGLCYDYGCEFEVNDRRQPPCIGDVSAFLGGLLWAPRAGVDLLVKMSRRFLPLEDWGAGLSALALESQYPTYCSHTESFGFGFRSECVGMAVRPWLGHRIHHELAHLATAPGMPFVEGAVHNMARRLAISRCERAAAWDAEHGPRPGDRDGFAPWPFMGTDRCTRYPGFLWHDSATPEDYHRLGHSWGLPYPLADYLDPNQGAGDGT
ncbi:hypothetical protein [Singulisphaera sp. PoT]|uniref:hypothetical protein n=1 Tax=Singulisphaera sp. PoT TaxID=3411797 RepID=UPI003BF5A9D4